MSCFNRAAGIVLAAIFCAALQACSCTLEPGAAPSNGIPLSVMTWNLQNLFDAVEDGGEYTEFQAEKWTWDAYQERLIRFSALLAGLGSTGDQDDPWPRILVFQEVENQRVLDNLYDAFKTKAGSSFPYTWKAACPKTAGSPITLGIMAKCPPLSQKAHRVWVAGESSRLVWELQFALDPAHPQAGTLVVFANHWKSKSGDAGSTEALRLAAAQVVRQRCAQIEVQGLPAVFVCAGDLNTQGLPGEALGEPQAILDLDLALSQTADLSGEALGQAGLSPGAALYLAVPGTWDDRATKASEWLPESQGNTEDGRLWEEPWLDSSRANPGSYFYDGTWERIDHTLFRRGQHLAGALEFSGFCVPALPGLLSSEGFPRRYSTQTRMGISDHLPVRLDLVFRPSSEP